MERQIGERFDYNGTTLEVVEATMGHPLYPCCNCNKCFFNNKSINFCIKKIKCMSSERSDYKNVYFIEV